MKESRGGNERVGREKRGGRGRLRERVETERRERESGGWQTKEEKKAVRLG